MQQFNGTTMGVNENIIQFMASTGKLLNMNQKNVAGLFKTMQMFGDGAQLNTKKTALWAHKMQELIGVPADVFMKQISGASDQV